MGTELPQQDKEGAQDDMRSGKKRPKEMKVEKTENYRTNGLAATCDGQTTKTRRRDISSQHNNPPNQPTVPTNIIKIATLNINGITARTRVGDAG